MKFAVLLGPTVHSSGSILNAESLEGSGSMAVNSNLNGFSALSNAKFLTISTSNRSSSSSLALIDYLPSVERGAY